MRLTSRMFVIFFTSLVVMFLAFIFRARLVEFRSLGLLGIFLINFVSAATLFLPAPAIATVLMGGFFYPPVLVALASSFGSAVGDTLGFLLGHSSGKVLLDKKQPSWMQIVIKQFHTYGDVIILLFAFIPNPFFDGIGIIAGMVGFPLYRYFLLLFVGRLTRDILLAYLGASFNFH